MGSYSSRHMRYKHFKEMVGPGVRTIKTDKPLVIWNGKTYYTSSCRILVASHGKHRKNTLEHYVRRLITPWFANGVFFYEQTNVDYDRNREQYWRYGKGDFTCWWLRIAPIPANCTLPEDMTR